MKYGNPDRADIGGIRLHGQRIVEVKDCARLDLPAWTWEAEIERGHGDALCGIVVHKRRGPADPAQQWVTVTVEQLVALLTGGPVSSPDLSGTRTTHDQTGTPIPA